MSEFAPGFAARHAAEPLIRRAFGGPVSFSPAEPGNIGRRSFAGEGAGAPRHFAPADPNANPTEGWDPFTPEVASQGPFVDPIAVAHAAGVAEGRATAFAEAEEARGQEEALLARIAEALAAGTHIDREAIAAQLRHTVLHLVRKIVGETPVAAELLSRRIQAAVELLAEGAETAQLRLHPDDAAALADRLPKGVNALVDAQIARGSFVLESKATIVEDGRDLWLDQLAQAIDRVPLPPC
ncbi:MAG: flagellar biosynthesis protein FliH [Sphingomonas sp.]|uniref:FliH/SctL family protein n=1 Tax=Sphingomonas sp. TaxID=28214 RepID=UPI001B06407A|nr:FliH/SctL family protein [Sphingomonas sp.]MBO9622031.1 flagellar biosynthesis protein FliH [Sphingomonas sp.]